MDTVIPPAKTIPFRISRIGAFPSPYSIGSVASSTQFPVASWNNSVVRRAPHISDTFFPRATESRDTLADASRAARMDARRAARHAAVDALPHHATQAVALDPRRVSAAHTDRAPTDLTPATVSSARFSLSSQDGVNESHAPSLQQPKTSGA